MKKELMFVFVGMLCLVVFAGTVQAVPSNFVERFRVDPANPDWVYQGPRTPASIYWEDNATHGGVVNAKLYRENIGTSWFYTTDISGVTGGPVDNTWDWTLSFQLYQESGYKVYPFFGLTSSGFIGDDIIHEPQYWIGYRLYSAADRKGRFYCDIPSSTSYSDISASAIYSDGQWYTVVISYDTASSELDYRVEVDGSDVFTWTKTVSGSFSFDTFAMWDYHSTSSFGSTAQYFDNLWIGSTADYDAASPVTITSQPTSLVLDSAGGNVQFAVAATNADTYQWYQNSVAISTSDTNFAGADSNTLTVYDVSAAEGDTGVYSCEASNAVFAVDSQKAALAIKDLVAHYKFDEGSGSTAADSSGYGNDADVTGATFLMATGPVDGGSLSFEAGDEAVLLSAAKGIPILGLPYTIEAWVNFDEDANNAVSEQIIAEYGDNDIVKLYLTDYAASDPDYDYSAVRIHWGISSLRADVYADYIDVIGNWVHYATTFDGTKRTVYVNGQKLQSDVPGVIYNVGSADNFTIAGGSTAGLFDDVKIYNYARSATQIADAVYAITGEPVCLEALGYGNRYEGGEDFNRDCKVDFADFADFAANWLDSNLYTTP